MFSLITTSGTIRATNLDLIHAAADVLDDLTCTPAYFPRTPTLETTTDITTDAVTGRMITCLTCLSLALTMRLEDVGSVGARHIVRTGEDVPACAYVD